MRDHPAELIEDMLCTCEVKPLGLDFVLTAGCILHDCCVCHDCERAGLPNDECLWCDSFVALLNGIALLGDAARERLKGAYLAERKLKVGP